MPEEQLIPAAQRLVVLVPNHEIDEILIGRRIWDLAIDHHSDILFLSVARDPDEELGALHKLAVLSAVTNDPRIHIETKIQWGISWQKGIQGISKPGDIIICFSSHWMRIRVFWRKPLSSLLKSQIDTPVYILSEKNFPRQFSPGHLTLESRFH